ncbi:MAG: hypothetical protein ACKOSS_12370 [Planctomycetia bacterium]
MRTPFLASCLVLLAACGGGGGGGGTPPPPPGPQVIDLPAITAASGWGVAASSALQTNVDPLYAGDMPSNLEARAIVSFGISSIPANAAVTAAELRIVQSVVDGAPYTDFASLEVDSVDIGPGLDAPDLAAGALSSVGALLPFDASLAVKTVDALAAVLADRIAGRNQTSLRLRFAGSPSADSQADRAGFAMPLGDPAQLPVLRVTYQP